MKELIMAAICGIFSGSLIALAIAYYIMKSIFFTKFTI